MISPFPPAVTDAGGYRGTVRPRETDADLRAAAVIVAALAVIGALLGLVWAAWSPPGPRALVLGPGAIQADETEAFVAADGRFLVLAAVVGLLAGGLAWTRARHRGPLVALGLVLGGLVGSGLTALVGRLLGGGTDEGARNTIIAQLPLSVHAHGLYFVEAGLAVLVYGLLTAFAVRDDLGRPDPTRDALLAAAAPPSVGPGDQPQYGGGYGDAPGVLQQRDLPPQ